MEEYTPKKRKGLFPEDRQNSLLSQVKGCVFQNDPEKFQQLLENHGDNVLNCDWYVKRPSDFHGYAIHHAALYGRLEIVKAIVQYRPTEVTRLANMKKQTPLHWAAQSTEVPKNIIEYLANHGASVNQPDEDGLTALYFATNAHNTNAVALLLKHDADINSRSKCGQTPLLLAIKIKSQKLIKVYTKRYGTLKLLLAAIEAKETEQMRNLQVQKSAELKLVEVEIEKNDLAQQRNRLQDKVNALQTQLNITFEKGRKHTQELQTEISTLTDSKNKICDNNHALSKSLEDTSKQNEEKTEIIESLQLQLRKITEIQRTETHEPQCRIDTLSSECSTLVESVNQLKYAINKTNIQNQGLQEKNIAITSKLKETSWLDKLVEMKTEMERQRERATNDNRRIFLTLVEMNSRLKVAVPSPRTVLSGAPSPQRLSPRLGRSCSDLALA